MQKYGTMLHEIDEKVDITIGSITIHLFNGK